jgi:phenylalanyl-tRNA synthetase alpha chain
MIEGMENIFSEAVVEATLGLSTAIDRREFEKLKSDFLGPNGRVRGFIKLLASVDSSDKPHFGQLINECKAKLEKIFADRLVELDAAELSNSLGPSIDPTIPVTSCVGAHPLSIIQERMVEIFHKIGFTVAIGPEIDTTWYCYDALNIGELHPARDAMDTLYFNSDLSVENVTKHGDEDYLMRSQTSTVQIRTMLTEEPPLRIVSPGRTFRRDTIDATHSANFHQCEGLVVDRNVSVVDLKAALDFFFKELFGNKCEIRFRPSFFPFTEPGFEVDFRTADMGKLSDRWIEVVGCGMVHPAVFASVGYDATAWSGYAFAFGIERLAMLMYGIDDIRLFYQNDTRFLRQFTAR